jgi:hypothetical protein
MLNYVGETDSDSRQNRLMALIEEELECRCRCCREIREDACHKYESRSAILKEVFSKFVHTNQRDTPNKEERVAKIRAGLRHAEMLLPVLERSYDDSDNEAKPELACLYRHMGIYSQILHAMTMDKTEASEAVSYLQLYLRHLGVVMHDEPVPGPPIDALKRSAVRSMPKLRIQDAIVTMLVLASIYDDSLKETHQARLWHVAGEETHRLAYAPSFEFLIERNKFIYSITKRGLARLKDKDKKRSPRG